MDTIFVQIASYCDKQLVPTVLNILSQSKHPESLRICIAWQHTASESIEEIRHLPNIQILDIDSKDSKGACWARSLIQQQYRGEAYTLQIDSHSRFVNHWDEKLIEMWRLCRDPKAILTGYPPEFNPNTPPEAWVQVPWMCNVLRFNGDYPYSLPKEVPEWPARTEPIHAVYVSAGFIFGKGEIITKVPYDPLMYFCGEECALAVRYFTHGFNLYTPHRIVLHHYYTRAGETRHWDDHTDWGKYDKVSYERLNALLGRNTVDVGEYGLGTERTLREFTDYTGIDFEKRLVHPDTSAGQPPPIFDTPERWQYAKTAIKQTVRWDYAAVHKFTDTRFWALIIKDQFDKELYRKDLIPAEYPDIISGKQTELTVEYDYIKSIQTPTDLIIWPYSNSTQWAPLMYRTHL